MRTLVVHHDDLDGRCAAAIYARYWKENTPDHSSLGFLEADYDSRPAYDKLKAWDKIVVLDFSLDQDTSRQLKMAGKWECWIDHHKTAIEANTVPSIPGIRKIGRAGCLLTWDYCFPGVTVPDIVELLGAYDIGGTEPRVMDIQYGMRALLTEPEMPVWTQVLNRNSLDSIQTGGHFVLQYVRQQEAKQLKEGMFKGTLDGHPVLACNGPGSSQFFRSLASSEMKDADMLVLFHQLADGRWEHGVYRPPDSTFDCSAVAKVFGGGGHAGASGFIAPHIEVKSRE